MAPLEVAEEPATEAVPLSMMGQSELPTTLVAPTAVGVMQADEAPSM